MKLKDLFTWWWNYDAPWWAWLALAILVALSCIHITINLH